MNTASAIELRHSAGLTGLAKEKIVQLAPNVCAAESVSVGEEDGKKVLKDAASAFIATSAWQVEMMKIVKYFKITRNQATISLVHPKLKISRNCRQQNWLKAYREISDLGVN